MIEAESLTLFANERPKATTSITRFFAPQTIAVIGASDRFGSVGSAVLTNLTGGQFTGMVYPVNPKHELIGGLKSYPSVLSLPSPIDLAVIAAPAIHVPDIVRECGMAGIRSAVILSAGFGECGPQGVSIEKQLLMEAKEGGVRIIGPNCLGLMRPSSGLNASFSTTSVLPGSVGFISQSGALCTALLDWSIEERVGFSAVVSVGSMLDVDWGDLLDYLANDTVTKSIVLYIESIGNAARFVAAARKASLVKPVIALKSGRSDAGARAARSHTGALASNDAVLDAAFRAAGVVRVTRMADLFNVAEALGSQPRANGREVAILTNAGGAGVLATDSVIEGGNGLADLSDATLNALNEVLPPHWSHANPVDVLGDAPPDRYAQAAEIVSRDPNVDGLLLLLTPQSMTDPTETARQIAHLAHSPYPVLAAWMGGAAMEDGRAILHKAGIPTYAFPDAAARVFNHLTSGRIDTTHLENVDIDSSEGAQESREIAASLIYRARQRNQMLLDAQSIKQILSVYGIRSLSTLVASTEQEVVDQAGRIGYPVALKLNSNVITHKTDVGGVQLNLTNAAHVITAFNDIRARVCNVVGPEAFQGVVVQPMLSEEGYELILGSTVDTQFGPVLMFGSGGTMVEIHKDNVLGLPPLTLKQAHSLMKHTRIYKALLGFRGRPPVNLTALADVLVNFSRLIAEQPGIAEIDINPLWVGADGAVAVDTRMILQPSNINETDVPRAALLGSG